MIKKVAKFVASDGSLFDSEPDAVKYEKKKQAIEKLEVFVSDGSLSDGSTKEIARSLFAGRKILMNLFNEYEGVVQDK